MSAIQQLIDYENDGNYLLADEAAQELASLRSEIVNYETARQEDARRLEHLQNELHQMTHNCVGAEMELEQVTAERDLYKRIIDNVRAGNYDNAHDITAARKFIYEQLAAMKGGKG